ncbi:MAG: 16S rRNA (cytidine(1402)-2'-O)-methyltransferase [Anaerolineae bacterium]|nr:16S rRNA (cytidine(1402)-2'-O)-methyltransferase [Anaerolineae bacterium]
MPTLYIVPTPIGNLEDITLRALRVLHESTLIAAEDTRTTRKLLARYEIDTPLTSYHEHNKLTKLDAVLAALDTGDVALVSDAGTPGISDPGYELVQVALARDIPVVPLPGPSAVITALVASGLPTDRFVFVGFLPRKSGALRKALADLAAERGTLIAYESPNRLVDTLAAVLDVLGERPVAVARELTKLYEEVQRGPVSDVLAHYRQTPPKGEITLVIGGAVEDATDQPWDADRVCETLRAHLDAGETRSAAARAVAEASGWARRDVYDLDVD